MQNFEERLTRLEKQVASIMELFSSVPKSMKSNSNSLGRILKSCGRTPAELREFLNS